ncbi:hypothetical protein N0V90_005356 [Kalmusia sp. IMI 367209]|nr:hypothetical protein N0V90_005356 [Kalmusia sp. IMI 367209]
MTKQNFKGRKQAVSHSTPFESDQTPPELTPGKTDDSPKSSQPPPDLRVLVEMKMKPFKFGVIVPLAEERGLYEERDVYSDDTSSKGDDSCCLPCLYPFAWVAYKFWAWSDEWENKRVAAMVYSHKTPTKGFFAKIKGLYQK